jgi:stage II sporulation protein D
MVRAGESRTGGGPGCGALRRARTASLFGSLALTLLAGAPAFASETMRIAIAETSAEVSLRATGLSYGPDAEDPPLAPIPGGKAVLRRKNGQLTLNGAPVGSEAVRLHADADAPIALGGLQVRGDVVVRLFKGGLQTVNVLPLEDYLVGVLGSEMPKSFPDAALRAQAIAARTYALRKKLEALDQPYHLGSGVLSQVYTGLAGDDPRTRAAVEATAGVVLTWQMAPIEAYFHASCGGRTESGLAALGRDLPYLEPVSCPCGKLPQSRWTLTVPRSELDAAVGKTSAVSVFSRSPSGRARRVRLSPDRVVDAVQFREKVGYLKVKSLAFEVEEGRDGKVTFEGRGFGHGAGLCQWGAKVMAEQGKTAEEILWHYYPGAELQQLY